MEGKAGDLEGAATANVRERLSMAKKALGLLPSEKIERSGKRGVSAGGLRHQKALERSGGAFGRYDLRNVQ